MAKNLKTTTEIVSLLAEVANGQLTSEFEIKQADIKLRTAKHAIQIYALLLASSQIRKETGRKLKQLELA